jgi:tetratricopeptide (TPR) repeat protein
MIIEKKNRYPWWLYILVPVVLIGITILFYYPSLNYAFQFDDYPNIVKYFNNRFNSLATLFLQRSRWISYWLNACYYHWSPQGAKYTPYLYRWGNVLFHAATGLFVFITVQFICLQAIKNRFLQQYHFFLATLVTGLFLLHPVQTQTVSYVIQGQLEGLAGLFCMALVSCFLAYTYVKTRLLRLLFLGLLFIVAVIACGTKEIIIVSPVLIMLVDWFFIAQGDWHQLKKRLWLHSSLLILILTLYTILLKPTYFLNIIGFKSELTNNIGNMLTSLPEQRITPWLFLISQFKVIIHYFWIFAWPFSMSADYDWKLAQTPFEVDVIIPFFVLCSCVWWLFKRLKKDPTDVIAFCFLWFFIAILPRSSIIPSHELLADYKTYIASFGIFFLFAIGLIKLIAYLFPKNQHPSTNAQDERNRVAHPERSRRMLAALIICILLLSGLFTYRRNLVWESPEAFWWHVIQNSPSKARAYNNYGVALCDKRRHADSIDYFNHAIQLDKYYPDPLNNIAVAYAVGGDVDLAITALRRSISLMPYNPETYNNLATMYIEKRNYKRAEELLFTAIKLRPHYGKAYRNLGLLYNKTNEPEKAWQAFKNCCTKADFDNLEGFSHYAEACLKLKKYEEAIDAFKQALKCKPNSLVILGKLAYLYAATKQYEIAERLYRDLIRAKPHEPTFLFQLSQLLYEQNRYQEAYDLVERIREIDPTYAVIYPHIARCMIKLGFKKDAAELLKNFIAEEPPAELLQETKQLLRSL